jgi:GNAT superfamily N-acetyltransferase
MMFDPAQNEVAMEGPRPPLENEFGQLISFLDSELRPNLPWSITKEYPLAFAAANIGNIRIITDQSQVLSHAVMRPIHVKTGAGLFKVAAIGSVVTSSEHRNQGLSTKILESCLDSAMATGCEFAILWTHMHDFYRKLGFELAGTENSVIWNQDLAIDSTGLKFMETVKVSPEAIHKIYNYHTVSSLRTLSDTTKYLQIPNTRIFTAWDQKNNLKAYAVEGKGADLKGHVHEWGGGVAALLPLFNYIYQQQKQAITIMIPRHSQNLLRKMKEHGLQVNEGFLGMIKPLNTTSLFTKVKRHARMQGIPDLILEQKNDRYYFGFEKNIFSTDLLSDITRLLFGPQKPSEIHNFDKDVSDRLDKILPLDMWIWGWDSI